MLKCGFVCSKCFQTLGGFFPTNNEFYTANAGYKVNQIFSLFNQPFDIMETLPYSFIHPIYPYDSLFFCKKKKAHID